MSQAVLNRAIFAKLQELERRAAGGEWRGKVTDIDLSKEGGMVRIALGKDPEGQPVKSPWVRYKQTAGAMKVHNPPSIGQTMAIRSEAGDLEQGLAEPYGWSNDNPANSDAEDEHVLTFGDVTITLSGGALVCAIGGVTFSFSGEGFVQTGGKQEHDGKNVGTDHKHGDVTPGSSPTGVPI